MPMPQSEALDAAQLAVDAAYALHDEAEDVKQMAAARDAALAAVDAAEASEAEAGPAGIDRQARLLYLRGKALASTVEGRISEEAEHKLADAIKLEPSLVDAWNCLGECFWERSELETARFIFLGALEHARTPSTLCHLSMLLRTMSGAMGREESLLLESVSLAMEAARLDPTSSRVWRGLGAAHLSVHLNVTSAAEDLHLANRAFTQAARVMGAVENADLYANHGTVEMLLDLCAPCPMPICHASPWQCPTALVCDLSHAPYAIPRNASRHSFSMTPCQSPSRWQLRAVSAPLFARTRPRRWLRTRRQAPRRVAERRADLGRYRRAA